MRPALHKLKTAVKHPATQLVTGIILLSTGIATACYEFMDAERNFRLGVHHGVALLGLIQVLGSIPELVDGLDRAFQAAEKKAPEDK